MADHSALAELQKKYLLVWIHYESGLFNNFTKILSGGGGGRWKRGRETITPMG